MPIQIDWNENLLAEVAERLIPAVDEIDQRIEAGAKEELYPGHGKLTGTLQRSIHTRPARREGSSIVGAVGTEPLPYARRIHRMYRYLLRGLEKVTPQVLAIIERHARRR